MPTVKNARDTIVRHAGARQNEWRIIPGSGYDRRRCRAPGLPLDATAGRREPFLLLMPACDKYRRRHTGYSDSLKGHLIFDAIMLAWRTN